MSSKATKLPSGAWRCRAYYTDEYGKYKSKSFTADTKKEAEYQAKAFLVEREHSNKPGNRTLGEAADKFLELSQLLSPSTLRGYQSIRNNAFQSIIDVRLERLSKEMYQKAINEYAKGDGKERSPKTVMAAHSFFNKVLHENDIHIGDNVTLPQKAKHEIQIPTTEEVNHFLEAIKADHKRLYLYCLFSITMGLRKSETIALTWEDIDFEHDRVSITKAKVRDQFNAYVSKTTKTTDSARNLHLPPILKEALQTEPDKEGLVFKSSPKGMESLYQRQCGRFDFHYNFHALRHYYASIMLINGVPTKYAQDRMGHTDATMLNRVYQHVFPKNQAEYDTVLDDFFKENF